MNNKDLYSLICSLEEANDRDIIVSRLQDINHYLLSSQIKLDEIEIDPQWVEAYYYNCKKENCNKDRKACKDGFCDVYSHKKEGQLNNYGHLYFHETGRGGVDLCLSNGNYYLSFLLKMVEVKVGNKEKFLSKSSFLSR